jgi:hypothetical protein
VTFTVERVGGDGIEITTDRSELMAVAADLGRRGRRELSERMRVIALGDPGSRTVVVRREDVAALVAAVDTVGQSMTLGEEWTRVHRL